MTREEGIKILKGLVAWLEPYGKTCKAIDMAIKALEKDTPKKPKKSDTPRYGMGYEYYDWCCPSCGKLLAYECDSEREKIHHCRCGQRLKWEESEVEDGKDIL